MRMARLLNSFLVWVIRRSLFVTVTVVSAVNPDDGFILSPVTHLISQLGTGTQTCLRLRHEQGL